MADAHLPLEQAGGKPMLATMVLLASMATSTSTSTDAEAQQGVQSMLNEESPDVFLAKATLQQYLSRVVRKDWDGAKRLTHPRTMQVIAQLKKRSGSEQHNLAPWADKETQLKTFHFVDARQVAPGIVAVQVGEDNFHRVEGGMSADDPAVYLMFKSRGTFLVGDKKSGVELVEVSDESVKAGYPGYVDAQVLAQARAQARR
jgi:hypothetical protein